MNVTFWNRKTEILSTLITSFTFVFTVLMVDLLGFLDLQTSSELVFSSFIFLSLCFSLSPDAPKFQTNQSIFYSWEGNPVNISCDVKSNPPATMLWRRDRFTISSQGTSNIRIHSAEGRSLLEVQQLHSHMQF